MPEERILHYRILRQLGVGGMGEVFLAEDERLGRRVALKFLPRADSAEPDRRERLRREARALASLSHPGIAGVHALEEHGDRLFLVMEFIEGETLNDRLAHRPLPVPEVIERGRVLAEALAHAHSRGVIHRDVKPSNILITPEGATKLADFGLALHEGETRLTMEGSTAGTADHMSPEQTRGENIDRRSDLFSLGVVLYEALTGFRPFARSTLEATFQAIRADEPEPPTALRSGVPLELERIVMKCLRKNPAERYQHAEDLAADLRVLHAGMTSTDSTRTVVVPSAVRLRKSRRLLLVVPALLLFVALAYLLSGLRPGARRGGDAEASERTIAVVSFQNMHDPGDSHREAVMAASLLTVGLGQSQVIPVLGLQRVQDVLKQMGKSEAPVSGRDALEAGRRAGATYIVTGYIYQTSPDVVLGAEVASSADGSVLTSTRVKAPGGEQGLFAAVDSLTAALRDGLSRAGFGVRKTAIDVAGLTTRNPAAFRNYTRGLDLLLQGNWTQAAGPLKAAIAADSTFALAWYYLAVATWWEGEPNDARAEVIAALQLNERLSGREREALRALGELIESRYDRAAKSYRKLLARYPDDKEFLYGLGEALYHGGEDDEGAREALERAIEIDPTFTLAYTHLVDIAIGREDKSAALAYADRLHAADPTSPASLSLRMAIHGRLGETEEALEAGREIVARFPESYDPIRRQMVLFSMLGEFDSARVVSDRLARSPVAAVRIQASLAPTLLALTKGRPREATQKAAESLRRLGPEAPALLTVVLAGGQSHALLELGRVDEAIAANRKAVAAIQGVSTVPASGYGSTIWTLTRAGRIPEAERKLRELDLLLGRSASLPERRLRNRCAGLIALARGRAGDAVRLLKEGGSLGPVAEAEVNRRQEYGRALIAAGKYDQAMAELEKAVARAPYAGGPIEPFRSMILLARLYEQRGRRAEALSLYRRVAYQYRFAEPGLWANEQAKAAIARMERARAQAAAD